MATYLFKKKSKYNSVETKQKICSNVQFDHTRQITSFALLTVGRSKEQIKHSFSFILFYFFTVYDPSMISLQMFITIIPLTNRKLSWS